MITILKVNVLTDDAAVPSELREQITALLRTVIRDDPEGVEHAKVSLEWKHTVHNRDYMNTLPPTSHVERIRLPQAEQKPVTTTKPARAKKR